MRTLKKYFLFLAALFFLMKASPAFAQGAGSGSGREKAMLLAFRDAQISDAIEKAEAGRSDKEKSRLQKKIARSEAISDVLSAFHPYVNVENKFNDNIFLIEKNTESDLINTLTPGVSFILAEPDIKLDFGVVLSSYLEHPEFNRQRPYLDAYYRLGKYDHSLTLENRFKENITATSELATGGKGIVDYDSNVTKVGWESRFNRIGFDLDYKRNAYYYQDDYKASNSYEEQSAGVAAFMQAFPKTRFFLEYDYGVVDYMKSASDPNNSNYNKIWAGVRGGLTAKASGLAKFGYEMRSYKAGTDYDAFAAEVDLSYKYSPKTSFLLGMSRQAREAGYASEGFNKQYNVGLSCLYDFSDRISFDWGILSYTRDNYEKGRLDNTYRTAIGLNYAFREWLKFGLNYRFSKKDSNITNGGYTDNAITLKTELDF